MRPIIGITVNCTEKPDATLNKGLALPDQTIQYVADDYVKAIERAGGTPVLIPITKDAESITPLLSVLNGILFSGGSDIDPSYYDEEPSEHLGEVKPSRDAHELALAKYILLETTLPYLGICRGTQLLNVACGGTLYQDLASEQPEAEEHSYFGRSSKHLPVHTVSLSENSRLYQVLQDEQLSINSFHHQSVKAVATSLKATAYAPDGVVEAMELTGDRFVLAVQWHPEMMAEHDAASQKLFTHFIQICRDKGTGLMSR